MEGADAELLSRIQFAFTIAVHITFPALSIGLAAFLAVLETLWLAIGRETFIRLYRYWIKPFAIVSAIAFSIRLFLA